MPPKEENPGTSVPSISTSKPSSASVASESSGDDALAAAALQKIFSTIETRFIALDSKIEALSLSLVSKLQSPAEVKLRQASVAAEDFESPVEFRFGSRAEHRPARQSFGSLHSQNSQDVVVRNVKSSFRLEKPKFEFPSDPKNDGAFDESVLKFIEECNRHIEMWLNLPENEDKHFEGSEVFALVSLPASVQKRVAHNLEMIYDKSEISGWTLEQIQKAKSWNRATTDEVKKLILTRKAQGISRKDAVRTIQPPAIAWPSGTGFIHLDAFEEYKSKLTTQISRLSEGGVLLPFIAIKDAIISAIPDRDFKIELYSQFGHSGSLPGPDTSGAIVELSMKSIFDVIRSHIVVLKQKGLAQMVNKNSVSFSSISPHTPQTSRKFGNHGPPPSHFSARAVQAIGFQPEFPDSDREFWSRCAVDTVETEISADDSDEFHQVNALVQKAKSKECHHQGIGPDGKLLCPYLGNPDSAHCGFIHPAKELELKGRGVSKSTPFKPKTVHNIVSGLGIDYAHESDFQNDGVGDL